MQEKRGSKFLRGIDLYIGSMILVLLSFALWIMRLFKSAAPKAGAPVLLVCFGAIGDLVILTTAARAVLSGQSVYLACSSLNYPCAKLYEDFYAGIAIIDINRPNSVLKACQKFKIKRIIDSTQWANIGPIQVAYASLFGGLIYSIGFRSNSVVRNASYYQVIDHSAEIHEVGNFMNLMGDGEIVRSNDQVSALLPKLYKNINRPKNGKVLLHMWPSGNRSHLKAWPSSYWQELSRYLVTQGYSVYLSGAPGDADLTRDFIMKSGLPLINLAGTFDLQSLSHFFSSEVEFAVSVNTGILHLLVEAGIPVIGLHGGVNPERWGPLGSNAISLLPESGHFAYLHYGFEYPEDDVQAYSLDKLTVAQVIGAIETLRADG